MAQLNAANVFRQVRDKFHVSLAVHEWSSNKEKVSEQPRPQPSFPTSEELERGAELIRLQKLNSTKRELTLEKTNHPNVPELLVLSLGESLALPERPKKKQPLLVFRPRLIHRSIFDMLDYYSGKKGHELGRAK